MSSGAVAFVLKAVLGIDTSEYEQGLEGAKGKASTIGGAIGKGLASVAKIGVAALGTATAAVGAFATSSVKAGADFDKSMSQVAATMGLTMDEMVNQTGTVDLAWGTFSGNLREYAQEMGKNTAFSATEAADALNYMALAGYDAQTSMQMLPNVLNLAAAGGMELARASDMVTDTQTAFGISLERTSQMVDEMAKAASTGNTSVEQLGDAFLTVGGLAQELNGGMVTLKDGTIQEVDGIQELEIALTAMANAGIKGSEAGTHMRNMLLKLSSPTSDGTKQLAALGVSVFDAEGNMRSMKDVMGDLSGALGELTQEQKIQAISDLFNTRDLASAEALLNAVGEDWDEIGESILDAEGAAQKMADTQLDNLAGDVTLFKSALEGAKIAVSDQLTPSLREFVKFGTDGLSRITQAFQEGGLSGAISAFGTVLSEGLTMIIEKVPDFINAGMQLLSALGQGLMDNIDIILFAIGDVVEMVFNGLLEATSGQNSAIMEIIDWIVGVFNENYGNLIDVGFQILENIITGFANALPNATSTLVEFVGLVAQKLISNIPTIIRAAIELAKGILQGLLQATPLIVSMIPELIFSLVSALTEAIPILIDGVIALVSGIVENLPTIIQSIIDAIPLIIDNFVNGLLSCLPVLLQGVISLTMAIIQALPTIIQVLTEAIPTIIQTVLDAVLSNLPQIIQGMIQLTMGIVAALPTICSALIEAIPQIIVMLVQAIIQTAPMLIEAVISILGTIGETLLSYGATFVEYAGTSMSNLLTTVVNWLSQLPEQMAYWAGEAIGRFLKFFLELPEKLRTLFETVKARVTEFGSNLKNKAIETGRNFFNGLIDNIKNLPSRMAELGTSLVKAVADLPKKFLDIGTNIVKGLWEGIQNAWSWLTEKVSGLFGSLVQGIKDGLGIESPSKVFAEIGKYVDEGYAKGILDNLDVVDEAMGDMEAITVNAPTPSNDTKSRQDDIIKLLEQIAENDTIHITLDGGLDRLFRIIQIEQKRNKQMTGQEVLA